MSDGKHFSSDELAMQRTLMAGERTLMAWTRTSISLISFGFTIYKFLQYMREQQGDVGLSRATEGPRRLGMALMALGVASLIIAGLQHWRFLGEIQGHRRRWGMSLFVVGAIALLGTVALMSILLRMGPF